MSNNNEENISASNTPTFGDNNQQRVPSRHPQRPNWRLRIRNRYNRRLQQQQITTTRTLTDAYTQIDSTSEINQESNSNDRNRVSIESAEYRSKPLDSVSDETLESTHVAPMAQINSPSGSQLVMLSVTNGPVTLISDTSSSSPQQQSIFVTQNPMKVAVSYAGETEARVRQITQLIHNSLTTSESPYPVFFARDFQDELVGLNGMAKLLKIYRTASLVVVFLSITYHQSPFCREEWRAIRNYYMYGEGRSQTEKLFFVKLSDYNAEELNLVSDDFYLDGLTMDDQHIADLIISRWRKIEQLPR
ncbi:hypothetical protein I4U23_013023 [Adineta vaga]|nr:hypothetical protein I4U23_013023 [Adineta vaga]